MACCILVAAVVGLFASSVRSLLRLAGLRLQPAVAWRPSVNPPEPSGLAKRRASFGHACNGIAYAIRTQTNMRIHLAITALVVIAGVMLRLEAEKWLWLLLAAGMVLAAETMNTAVEQICDLVSPGPNLFVKNAKDLTAGCVLITAITAAVIGLVIFGSAVWPETGYPSWGSLCGTDLP